MVYSASFVLAGQRFGDSYYFLKKQAVAAAIGLPLLFLAARLDYRRWQVLGLPLLILSAALLAVLILPGMRHEIGGSARWLKISFFSFQPAELAKLALVIYLARSLTKKEGRMKEFTVGFLPHLVVLADSVRPGAQAAGLRHRNHFCLPRFPDALRRGGELQAFRGDGVGRAAGFALYRHPGEIPAGAAAHVSQPLERSGKRRVPDHPIVLGVRIRKRVRGRPGGGEAEAVLPSGGAYGFHFFRHRGGAGADRGRGSGRAFRRPDLSQFPGLLPGAGSFRDVPGVGNYLSFIHPDPAEHGSGLGSSPDQRIHPAFHQLRRHLALSEPSGSGDPLEYFIPRDQEAQ